jgi:hypothetical protein
MCPLKNLEVLRRMNTYRIPIYKINLFLKKLYSRGHIRAVSVEFAKMIIDMTDELGDKTKNINVIELIASKKG